MTIDQAMHLALTHHKAGRFAEAESICRQVLASAPQHAGALSNLGYALYFQGRLDEAIDAFRSLVRLKPDSAETLNNFGNVLKEKRRLDEAISAFRGAIKLKPDLAMAHYNLGNTLAEKGDLAEAIAAFRSAIQLKADDAAIHNYLANALKDQGELDEAIAAYRIAIKLKPDYAEAHSNLADALNRCGKLDEAFAASRTAIQIKPNLAEAHNVAGIVLHARGQADEAIAAFRVAVQFKPDFAEAFCNLGGVLKDRGQLDQAIAACRKAIQLRPDFTSAYNNLGAALKSKGELDQAIAAFRTAVQLHPRSSRAHNNLGAALQSKGQLDEAIAAFGAAIRIDPSYAEAHSNLVYAQLFHPSYDAAALAEAHGVWNKQHAEPLRKFIQSHVNDRDADRPLKIGYVSPDFRDHVVGRNLLPLLRQHDRARFEITCYANVSRADDMTRQFQQHADRWRNIVVLSDERAAEQIREDGIDILVDLTLHLANNRLRLFARKPAPVQVTFAGYPGTTGLTTIDYRLSDPYLDPSDIEESIYSEQTIRLPDSFWCYDPLDCRDVSVNSLPASSNGFITFGCLNNFCKINDDVLKLWAQVMRQVADARLLLLAGEGHHRERTKAFFQQEGIDPHRVEFFSQRPRRDYLLLYHAIDIGLDSFPYNGHTTSLDSLWMGVPMVTLMGHTIVGRAGWSQLSNLGLTELAAQTSEQFVQIAVDLANDRPKLAQMRATLRSRMETSPLMDAQRFARNIEAVYRQMWRRWCDSVASGIVDR